MNPFPNHCEERLQRLALSRDLSRWYALTYHTERAQNLTAPLSLSPVSSYDFSTTCGVVKEHCTCLVGSYSAVYWESIKQATSLLVAHWLFQILFLWLLNSVYKLSTCFCTTAWKLLTVYLMQVSCHLTPSKAASSPNLCFSMYYIG